MSYLYDKFVRDCALRGLTQIDFALQGRRKWSLEQVWALSFYLERVSLGPLEVFYFVEGATGKIVEAEAHLLVDTLGHLREELEDVRASISGADASFNEACRESFLSTISEVVQQLRLIVAGAEPADAG